MEIKHVAPKKLTSATEKKAGLPPPLRVIERVLSGGIPEGGHPPLLNPASLPPQVTQPGKNIRPECYWPNHFLVNHRKQANRCKSNIPMQMVHEKGAKPFHQRNSGPYLFLQQGVQAATPDGLAAKKDAVHERGQHGVGLPKTTTININLPLSPSNINHSQCQINILELCHIDMHTQTHFQGSSHFRAVLGQNISVTFREFSQISMIFHEFPFQGTVDSHIPLCTGAMRVALSVNLQDCNMEERSAATTAQASKGKKIAWRGFPTQKPTKKSTFACPKLQIYSILIKICQ